MQRGSVHLEEASWAQQQNMAAPLTAAEVVRGDEQTNEQVDGGTRHLDVHPIAYEHVNASFESTAYLPARPSDVKVATIALGADGCRPLKEAWEYLNEAGRRGVDLALLPEQFSGMPPAATLRAAGAAGASDTSSSPMPGNPNCTTPFASRPAETLDGPVLANVSRIAATWQMNIIAPIRRLDEATGHQFNSQVVLDRRGRIAAVYDKIFPVLGARGHEGSGIAEPGVWPSLSLGQPRHVDLDFGRVGLATCFDINFAEVWAALGAASVDLIAWPSAMATPDPLAHAYSTLLRTPILSCGSPGEVVGSDGGSVGQRVSGWPRMTIGTLDLDATWIHSDNNGDALEAIEADLPGVIEVTSSGPHFHLRSTRPSEHPVRRLLKKYEIESYSAYIHRSRLGLNELRARGQPI
jgi:predicted amidohydrolase